KIQKFQPNELLENDNKFYTSEEQLENLEEAIIETIGNIDKLNASDKNIYDEAINECSDHSFSQVTNYRDNDSLKDWFIFKFDNISF
ncbi:33825_t:CDS:1, partial [Gigaspora margarita]